MYRKQSRNQGEQTGRFSKWTKINPESLSKEARAELDTFYGLLKEAQEAKKRFAALVTPAIVGKVQGATEDNTVLAFRYGVAFRILSAAELAAGQKRDESLFDL